ncbi:MAG: aminodeoxychorismate/anthranilate synthase component II [Clostridiales bacterium]|nr:aminodeoxychorismate/anthranilate synthase component II [Clostridiales bacterium]
MILLIDNYDSFSYNLYQLVGSVDPDIRVVRNDELTAAQAAALQPRAVILSPGPGRPENAGICTDVVRELAGSVPILGVCLGHQAICTAYGGTVSYAARLMHGKQSQAVLDLTSPLFRGCRETEPVARYHSLSAVEGSLPDCLRVTARAEDGEIMAVQHTAFPVFGLQFHPESILTPCGKTILQNFIQIANGGK